VHHCTTTIIIEPPYIIRYYFDWQFCDVIAKQVVGSACYGGEQQQYTEHQDYLLGIIYVGTLCCE